MTRRLGLLLIAMCALAAPARAVSWSQAFADEPDTVCFLASNGELWRAPFSLGAREVVWTPGRDERIARVRVSPDGRHVAWISRAGDEDTTRLFIDGGPPRTRYFSVIPARFHMLHFEAGIPTTEDRSFEGARFLVPAVSMRRQSANACCHSWSLSTCPSAMCFTISAASSILFTSTTPA